MTFVSSRLPPPPFPTIPFPPESPVKSIASLTAVQGALEAYTTARKDAPEDLRSRPVITIARETGTNATEIAAKVAERLNELDPGDQPWVAYDRELVEKVAEENKLEDHLVEKLDEHDENFLMQFFRGLVGGSTPSIAMRTARTMRGLAKVGRAVIVGRGGQVVLHAQPHVLHVRLTAPLDWRIEQWARGNGLDAAAAREQVLRLDGERRHYVKTHFHRDPESLDLYDLVVNVAGLEPDAAVDLIADASRRIDKPDAD